MVKLQPEEFHQALQQGIGRTYLYIKKYGDSQVKDSILYYCLNHPAYDPQCEGGRADWLVSLIDLTGNQEFYFSKIIDGLIQSKDFWSTEHLFELCGIIAQRNIQRARIAIYHKFDLQEFDESWLGGYEIIDIERFEGLEYVTQRLGKRLCEEKDYWDDGGVLDYAYEKLGKVEVSQYLENVSKTNRYVKRYHEVVESRNTEKSSLNKESRIERIRRTYSLKKALSDIENQKYNFPYQYITFGKYATITEIELIFQKLLEETRKEQIIRYLWVFMKREVPRLDDKLSQFAVSDDEDIRHAAIWTLKLCQDNSIRDLAINLNQHPDDKFAVSSIGLFIKNYQSGDNKYIESVFSRIRDENTIHFLCTDLIHIFEENVFDTNILNKNVLDELLTSLLWAYENTPCTICRTKIVRNLIENNLIPQSIIDECQFDCVDDIRNLAREYEKNQNISNL
ncbi:MAG: hypothetical protein AAF208_11315 [Cyanobacteria bacterium P01_A01_bin.45]